MKLGLVARADERGIGRVTHEFYRAMRPERTLVVREPGAERQGFVSHLDRYPDAAVVVFDAGLDETACRGFLDGLDVVYLVETAYDPSFYGWAREAGVATVLHVMPEFFPAVGHPEPDAIWAPTTWRLDALPARTVVVPVPVATDRLSTPPTAERGGPLRVLHVAGHRAAMDRNGTQTFLRALGLIGGPVEATIIGQDGRLPGARARRGSTVTMRPRGVADYWKLYAGQDVLVMPRRYGGLCLPVQEGLASGLVPVMPDVSPNTDWPSVLVPATTQGHLETAAGALALAQVNPRDLAAAIDRLVSDPAELAVWRERARAWSLEHSWEALGPLWLEELERAR